jgi:small conductance mechanosensitive channel
MTWNEFWTKAYNWLIGNGLPAVARVIIALIIMFVTFKVINLLARRITKRCEKRNVDKTIARTLIYIGKLTLKIVITICLVGFVGIDTSGLTAIVTSLGVCIGLAVNGALSNLAGGVMLIITRPFKIDDYIEACGQAGTVEAIHITQTILRTSDNKVVYIPNGTLSSSEIINYSAKDTRRLDLVFGISYDSDVNKAKEILTTLCDQHNLVLKDPAPFIRVKEQADSSINLLMRVWVNSGDYWTVNFDMMENVLKAFNENGIEIPFNQLDVNVINKTPKK